MLKCYYMNERPASPGAVPSGFVCIEDSISSRYGVICYDRELTKIEINKYELDTVPMMMSIDWRQLKENTDAIRLTIQQLKDTSITSIGIELLQNEKYSLLFSFGDGMKPTIDLLRPFTKQIWEEDDYFHYENGQNFLSIMYEKEQNFLSTMLRRFFDKKMPEWRKRELL